MSRKITRKHRKSAENHSEAQAAGAIHCPKPPVETLKINSASEHPTPRARVRRMKEWVYAVRHTISAIHVALTIFFQACVRLFSLDRLADLQKPPCSYTYINIVHPLKNISNPPEQHRAPTTRTPSQGRRLSCCCCARRESTSNEHVQPGLRGRPSSQTIIDARTSNELHIQHITRTCDATTMARIPPGDGRSLSLAIVPTPRRNTGQAILTAENRFE